MLRESIAATLYRDLPTAAIMVNTCHFGPGLKTVLLESFSYNRHANLTFTLAEPPVRRAAGIAQGGYCSVLKYTPHEIHGGAI